jgi:hypothetical protein
MSCPTQKKPRVSSPAAATGTDTGVCQYYWYHDFILFKTDRGNMPKNESDVKSENKFLFEIHYEEICRFFVAIRTWTYGHAGKIIRTAQLDIPSGMIDFGSAQSGMDLRW